LKQNITEEELIEVENQLSFPNGEKGIEMAKAMNDTNIEMTLESIKALDINDNNAVLEIGHGNCGHLSKTLKRADNISFFGLEISETMQKEAESINKNLLNQSQVEFQLYDGKTMPFQENSFDRIMTVNTVYFWEHPADLLTEIYRVLKYNGLFVITYAQKKFMEKLPFVKEKFSLFDNQDIKNLISKTDFTLIEILDKKDNVESKIGDLTNSIDNVDNYNSKQDQKLNYGIYSADMAYCIMNNQTQESINYLSTLKKLSEKIWMTDVMGAMGLSQRLEANVGNEDSLTYIMADLQMQMDDYLDENEMGAAGSIIFAGAWIETMYLGVKVNENEGNEKLINRLSEQAIILESLIGSIKQNNNDNQLSDLLTDLESINKHFTGFNDSEEQFRLSAEAIHNLNNDITALRTKIVGE